MRMTRAASKRAKMMAADSSDAGTQPPPFIPFQTGPGLDRIPDDVLLEILSHLPTLREHTFLESMFGLPSMEFIRTSTLRALSQTSRLLRSRCLEMAWQKIELCSSKAGEETQAGICVLEACPYLLPLIQTVSVILTHYQYTEVIPALANCLATLPNLTTIQVIYQEPKLKSTIKRGFQGIQFPSVRRISLPSDAHEIIRSCPNLEEVTCTYGNGSTIVGTLAKSNCQQLRILKGIDAPLTQLVDRVPNLRHVSVSMEADVTLLASFPLLDTIEINVNCDIRRDLPLSEVDALDVKLKQAREILNKNDLQAEKAVLLTKWYKVRKYINLRYDRTYTKRETLNVTSQTQTFVVDGLRVV